MNIVETEKFGKIEAIKLGYGPLGPPFMSVYLYVVDGLVVDTGQRNMQKAVLDLKTKITVSGRYYRPDSILKNLGIKPERHLQTNGPGG